jgi:Fic family protein
MDDRYEEIVDMWRLWRVETVSDIDERLDNFRILFAYNSGKIENEAITYHDTKEIFENARALGFSGDPRALFEQRNQKLCYEFLKDKIASREPLTVPLVLETHGILTAGTYDERRFVERGERPGAFKKHDYVTGRNEVGSLPENVSGDMAALLEEVQAYKVQVNNGSEVLKAAAYFHSRFEYIHPFADGNGRAGRTLLNYFLMIRNHPPLIIHDEEKAAYYTALEAYDKTEEITPMCNFLRLETVRTWEKSLDRERGYDSGRI